VTKRQLEVLRMMKERTEDEDGELVYERGVAYIGTTRIAARTVWALIRAMAIKMSSDSNVGGFERYTITETGRALLREAGA
jgi:hypothetical protein